MGVISALKGVEDVLPPKASLYRELTEKAAAIFLRYGYSQIIVPIFEKTQLFLRSVGQETDVGKQMYTFDDRGGRSISLRPEGTAGIARAYIEHKIYAKEKNWKVCYAGPMFRYEKPQAGRLREFYQIGVESFGEESPWIDVEIIDMANHFLKEIGLSNVHVQINSIGCKKCRPEYVAELKVYLEKYLNRLCTTCVRRFTYNPLRILDCKNNSCQTILENAPRIKDFFCLDCKNHFNKVQAGLSKLNVVHTVNDYLVRGLDYYTQTIFEITSSCPGSQNAVCAGGRYDNLVEELGGPNTPAIGFAMGVERLLISLEKAGVELAKPAPLNIFVVTIGRESMGEGMRIAGIIRAQNIQVKVNLAHRGLSDQLKDANKGDFPWVLIVGEEELQKEKFILKNMNSGAQQELKIKNLDLIGNILRGDIKP